ncbi:MAG: phosphoserine phosphatase SerB [Desulfobacteraceae bacterium 4572_187]|nr:MAG: phosphoserine phosphatase SerB [Desulfobacteraceae bacterium 4572_187]
MSSLYVISAVGKDKPGLVHSLTNVLSDLNINIVDADARAVRGHFSMFLVVDLITSRCTYEDMVQALETVSTHFDLGLRTEKYVAGRRKSNKKLMVLTFMGRDQPGIVASISGILSENSINIEQIKMIARGEYIAIDMTIDTCDFPHTQSLRKVLYKYTEKLGLDISLRNDNVFSKPKRVIVFDCDSTIIQQEVIDELAKTAGVDQVVREITNKAMNGAMDFQESLKERVKLLRGLPVEKLELLINTIKLTPGAEELISTLRFMGYKIAVISGGFSFFTDYLKNLLNLDYVFANELEIENGVVTGKIKGEIIDAKKKGELIEQIADIEGINADQIVAVGDGSNDRFMLSNAGLAIGFNPKEILKDYSDGVITSDNISGLLYFLGIPDTDN